MRTKLTTLTLWVLAVPAALFLANGGSWRGR